MPIITTDNLTRVFTTFRKREGLMASLRAFVRRERIPKVAVDHVSFEVEAGEVVGFLGPNGAGKTTTLKLLSGILHPTEGTAEVLGHVPWRREPAMQRQFALVMGQKNQLWWDLPAADSFLLNRDIYQIPDRQFREKLEELTTLFELAEIADEPLRKLSLGQRMKCELVGSLLHSPRLLFLDEPTIGLDVVAQRRIREYLGEYNRRTGMTILLTSHNMQDIEEVCERVLLMDEGRIVYDDALDKLVARHATHKMIRLRFDRPIAAASLSRFGEIEHCNEYRASLRVPRGDVPHVASQILSQLPVEDLGIQEITAEQVLRELISDRAAEPAAEEETA